MKPKWQHHPEHGNNIYSIDIKDALPHLNLQNLVDSLNQLNLKTMSYEQIKNLIFSFSGNRNLLYFKSDFINELYRGRIYQTESLPANISEVWYPSSNKIERFGRANKPNQSMFYCCAYQHTVLAELNPCIDEYICVIKICKNKEVIENKIIQLGFERKLFEIAKVKNPDEYEEFFKSKEKYYESKLIINDIPMSELSDSFILNKYYFQQFTKRVSSEENYEYYPSVAIAEFWFNNPLIKGICYPSLFKSNDGFIFPGPNFAISPDIVDQNYKPINIYFYKVIEKNGNTIQLEMKYESHSISENGDINWLICK